MSNMKQHEKTRDAASEALIALRTAMGKTQAQFAVTVLDTAVTTIARYETSHPPQGELLLRLSEVAEQQQLFKLRDIFGELYVKQVLKKLGFDLMTIPRTEAEQEHGYLFKRLNGEHALAGAQSFLLVLAQLESDDSEIRQHAIGALSALKKAARKFTPTIVGDIQDAFASLAKAQPQPTTKKRKPAK